MLAERKEEFLEWVRMADGDLKVARQIFNGDDKEGVLWIMCFHCQQAVEKYFKSYIAGFGNEKIERTHNLPALAEKCKNIGDIFNELDQEYLGLMSRYAVHGRYPFFKGKHYTEEEAEKALAVAEEIAALIKLEIEKIE